MSNNYNPYSGPPRAPFHGDNPRRHEYCNNNYDHRHVGTQEARPRHQSYIRNQNYQVPPHYSAPPHYHRNSGNSGQVSRDNDHFAAHHPDDLYDYHQLPRSGQQQGRQGRDNMLVPRRRDSSHHLTAPVNNDNMASHASSSPPRNDRAPPRHGGGLDGLGYHRPSLVQLFRPTTVSPAQSAPRSLQEERMMGSYDDRRGNMERLDRGRQRREEMAPRNPVRGQGREAIHPDNQNGPGEYHQYYPIMMLEPRDEIRTVHEGEIVHYNYAPAELFTVKDALGAISWTDKADMEYGKSIVTSLLEKGGERVAIHSRTGGGRSVLVVKLGTVRMIRQRYRSFLFLVEFDAEFDGDHKGCYLSWQEVRVCQDLYLRLNREREERAESTVVAKADRSATAHHALANASKDLGLSLADTFDKAKDGASMPSVFKMLLGVAQGWNKLHQLILKSQGGSNTTNKPANTNTPCARHVTAGGGGGRSLSLKKRKRDTNDDPRIGLKIMVRPVQNDSLEEESLGSSY